MQSDLFSARQTQGCLQAQQGVTPRLAQASLQILDAAAADAGSLGQRRLREAGRQPGPAPEPAKGVFPVYSRHSLLRDPLSPANGSVVLLLPTVQHTKLCKAVAKAVQPRGVRAPGDRTVTASPRGVL